MYALWAEPVNGGRGKEKYGDEFADIYAINRLHFKAAMNNDCDHVSRNKCSWAPKQGQLGTARTVVVSSEERRHNAEAVARASRCPLLCSFSPSKS